MASHEHGETGHDAHSLLPRSSSLVIMLVVFTLLSLLILFAIISGGSYETEGEEGGKAAYGPADFPQIAWDIPPVPPPPAGDIAAFTLPPPPFSDPDLFPCSGCHADMEPDRTPRALTDFHEEIQLHHGPADRWCFDCHDPDDRDHLRLTNGTKIGFDESYRLCGQCHGTIYRDWRQGIHGRRRGFWNGPKSYLLCAHCHDPHAAVRGPRAAAPQGAAPVPAS
ncbi:MAG: hypothetical protein C0395_05755 [Gemmatimonas sp.]|nr:hypothetical protein [Gemmatimonas sp.]